MSKRAAWKFHETEAMLQIIIRKHRLTLLDSAIKQNRKIYEDISRELAKQNINKSEHQIRNKFKIYKSLYYKTLHNEGRAAVKNTFGAHFDLVEKLYGTVPRSPFNKDSPTVTHKTEFKPEEIQDEDLEDGIIQFIETPENISEHEEKYITHESSAEEEEEVESSTKERPTFQLFEDAIVQPFETLDSTEAGIEDGISMHMKSLAKDINDANLPQLQLMKLKRQMSNMVYDFILNYKEN